MFCVIDLICVVDRATKQFCDLQDCLALGVIFAATDSVAVLQVLKQDKMPLLYSLVFGEGVINDATSVALLRAVQVKSSFILPLNSVTAVMLHFCGLQFNRTKPA